MGAYRTSLYQICRSQFVADRSFPDGALGMLEIAQNLPLDDVLLQEDFSLDDIRVGLLSVALQPTLASC